MIMLKKDNDFHLVSLSLTLSHSLVKNFEFPHCNLVHALVRMERRDGRRPADGIVFVDIAQNKMMLERHPSDD